MASNDMVYNIWNYMKLYDLKMFSMNVHLISMKLKDHWFWLSLLEIRAQWINIEGLNSGAQVIGFSLKGVLQKLNIV